MLKAVGLYSVFILLYKNCCIKKKNKMTRGIRIIYYSNQIPLSRKVNSFQKLFLRLTVFRHKR